MKNYADLWLILVHIKPEEGFSFKDLVDSEGQEHNLDEVLGAWANVLVKGSTRDEAVDIIPEGFKEKNFEVVSIDQVENLGSVIEKEEVNKSVIEEADWLLDSKFVFLISNKIFPYNSKA
jgi:hypothetical protein